VPKCYHGLRPLAIFLLLWAAAVYPAACLFGWKDWRWVAVSGGVAFFAFIVIGGWLYRIANRQATGTYLALRRTLFEAGLNQPIVLETSKAQCQRLNSVIVTRQKR